MHLVTGGFAPLVAPLAARLGVPADRVHANRLLFAAAAGGDGGYGGGGAYAGFDASEPTARAGGKRLSVAAALAAVDADAAAAAASRGGSGGGAPAAAVMVGDGATDAEARGEGGAGLFVGYGGVARRAAVRAAADWYINDLRALLEHI